MTDLICERCGKTATYADASIADLRRTCEETRTNERGREFTLAARHEWTEAAE